MQKILMCCKSLDDARMLKSYIEHEMPYQVLLSFDKRDLEWSLKNKSIHLLLLQSDKLVQAEIDYVHKLRQGGFSHPVLMVTDAAGELGIDKLAEKFKIYVLERPFEFKNLKGLTRKLMSTKTVPQQIFRRFRTNLTASIETFISGEKFETHMFNLSRGGAYFELAKKPGVGIGDLLRLKVPTSEMEKNHNVHGRIVWTTHKGHAAGGYGLGIKFVKGSEIYRSLIDKV